MPLGNIQYNKTIAKTDYQKAKTNN